MRTAPYGKTGKEVSILGFGGMRFDLTKSLEENADLVRYASSRGINYFDTAPGYCQDQSEEIMGLAFRSMPRPFYCATKAMPTSVTSAAAAVEAVARSRERLGAEAIDFFHVWCLRRMEHYEAAIRPGGLYDGLVQCRERGWIRHIVFSSHQPGFEIRTILESRRFEGVLLGVNLLNFPYRWDGVEAARENGAGVVVMNPLGGGLIPRHEEAFGFLARPGETPTEAALRFVLGAPQIDIALVGFSSRAEVDAACRVAETAEPFAPGEVAAIRRRLGAAMNQLCTGCGYCTGCPQEIPIAAMMQFYNEQMLFHHPEEKMRDLLRHHLTWGLFVGAHGKAGACVACGLCERKCTQHLPIMERLRAVAAWEEALSSEATRG